MAGKDIELRVAIDHRAILGEGPLWSAAEQSLYWLDLRKPAIYRFDPTSGRNERLPGDLGTYVGGMVFDRAGQMIVVKEDGLYRADPATGERRFLAHPDRGNDKVWFNDAKVDRMGALWSGTGDRAESAAIGSLYRFAPDLGVTKIDSGIICPNGPAFSPDGRTAYFCDSYAREIYRYAIDLRSGQVGPRQLFATIPEPNVFPDGMTVDRDGYLWNAQWGGARVVRYAPDGRIDRVVDLPVPQPSAVGFGGAKMDQLYITTAAFGMSDEALRAYPQSGMTFVCSPGAVGLIELAYLG